MTIIDQVRAEIDSLISRGASQKEMANRFGLSQTHMCKLISGGRCLDGLALHSIQHAFPNALLTVGGSKILNAEAISGDPMQVQSSGESLRSKILSRLIDLDISDDAKVKVMKLVRDTK